MTAAESNPEFRSLIDARLDAIEQILLRVQVSYSERRHIVSDVETQIFELLARRGENPTRDDVVALLDSLDPPESYIPEEFRGRLADAIALPAQAMPKGPRLSKVAVGSAVLVLVVVLFGVPLVASSYGSDFQETVVFFSIDLFLATLLGVAALARIWRSKGALRGLPFALFASLAFPLVLVNFAAVIVVIATHGVLPWLVTGAGIVYLNYLGVHRLWRWLGTRHGNIADALRGDVTGWLNPRNGIQPT